MSNLPADEKIVKPIFSKSEAPVKSQKEDKKLDQKTEVGEEAKVAEAREDVRLKSLADGAYYQFEWEPIAYSDQPLWRVVKDALNLGNNIVTTDQNLIADVGALSMTILQSDDPEELFKFLRQELTKVPSAYNPVYSLWRNLQFRMKEELKNLERR